MAAVEGYSLRGSVWRKRRRGFYSGGRRCRFRLCGANGSLFLHPVEGYEQIQAQPFENRFLLDQVPDFWPDRL